MEWTEITLDALEANCPPEVLKAYSAKALAGFDERILELETKIQEAAVEPEPEPEPEVEPVAAESDTTKIEARLAAVETRERQADARDVLQVALAESKLMSESKTLVARRFVDAAPEDKAKFTETVNEEIKAMAEHDKAITESVRLPGTGGVISEASTPANKVDVRAGIAKAAGVKPKE